MGQYDILAYYLLATVRYNAQNKLMQLKFIKFAHCQLLNLIYGTHETFLHHWYYAYNIMVFKIIVH